MKPDFHIARNLALIFLTAGLLVGSGLPAFAQEPSPTPHEISRVELPETDQFTLMSEDGYKYSIYVSVPRGDAPKGGFPALYILDGDAFFAGFAETRRNLDHASSDLGKAIIVGVAYGGDQPWAERRLYDFTGPGLIPEPWRDDLSAFPAGGWNEFLDFLTGPLRDEIRDRYDINDNRQSLYGHSLGGLFAIHALFQKPGAFHAITAASPSLFWHEIEMLKAEQTFTSQLKRWEFTDIAKLQIVTGELEEVVPERTHAEAFAKRIEALSRYGLHSEFKILDDETHVSVPARSITSTLRFAFAWP